MFNSFIKDVEHINNSSGFPVLETSRYKFSKIYNENICELIEKSDILSQNVLDLACGDGNHLYAVHKKFNSKCVGVDIRKSTRWDNYESESIYFFKQDIDQIIKNITCKKPFDIIITMNTLRSKLWNTNYLDKFLTWCSKNCKYLITNNCENNKFKGFKLVDNLEKTHKELHPGLDVKNTINLFKSKNIKIIEENV
jgi:hypothetical protein|tara:strand:+ start:424 stop:1011 length:588 start_codon:yes stop_codon:yes gene_type:complete